MVPSIIQDANPSIFKHQMFSIGPLHKEDKKVQEYEMRKATYLHDLPRRINFPPEETLKACVHKVNALIHQIRACYAEMIKPYTDVELETMMVMDACFILEFHYKAFFPYRGAEETLFLQSCSRLGDARKPDPFLCSSRHIVYPFDYSDLQIDNDKNYSHVLDLLHFSHLSPTSQTSLESSNGQPSPVSTTSIPTPPPPTPPPPPPLITQQRLANLRQNPKQRVPYNPFANHATVLPTTITEPTSFTVANNSLEWHQAMKEEYEEYDALMKNGMWSLVPRASTTNVVDGKWVYRLKRDKNGAIIRYKARFVAKGFRQQLGIDFHETFSLVVKSTTIRAVLSLAVTNDWPLCQLDIQNAFLHGNLKEHVYMKQPPGFIDPQRPNHVCLFHKYLYGLKQAPRAWFERLSKALFDLGFKGSKTDPSLFIYSRGDTLLYILVYVDDIIVTCNNKGTINNIICQLGSAFALKDLGPLNYFLGIEIVSHVFDILLSQKKYVLELLQSDGLSNCNPVSSPMVTSSSLSLDDSTAFSNPVKY
ncbi:retrovirus-related pol polyprotein from transposon TNT 1-94 [Tanacetum coccineum]